MKADYAPDSTCKSRRVSEKRESALTERWSHVALAGLRSLGRIVEGQNDFQGLSYPESYRLSFVRGFSVHTHWCAGDKRGMVVITPVLVKEGHRIDGGGAEVAEGDRLIFARGTLAPQNVTSARRWSGGCRVRSRIDKRRCV